MADVVDVVGSGGFDCHLMSGCGFPAPGTEIFEFTPLVEFSLFGITFGINKPVILLILVSAFIIFIFTVAFAKAQVGSG